MKLILSFLMVLVSFSVYSENEINYVQKIENSASNEEKEKHYLEWVRHLSQINTLACDSVINKRNKYISSLSDNGKIALLITYFNNSRLSGSLRSPDFSKYQLNKADLLLVKGMLKCAKKESISKEDYEEIKRNLKDYDDPMRKSLFYAISTCVEGIDRNSQSKYYNSSIKYAKLSPLKTVASFIYDINSLIHLDKEDFEEAIINHQKGISFSKENNLTANIISHLINIGNIQYKLSDFKKAEESFLEAQELATGLNIDFISGQLFNYLGELYNTQNKLNKSIQYYQKSLIKFYNINNSEGLANVHKNIGKAYFDNGDTELAEKNYELSLEFSKENDGRVEKGELFYLISQLFLKKNELYQAEVNIKKAIAYWEAKNHVIPLNKAYLQFAHIKVEQGNYSQANEYFKRYINFSDSIHKQETAQKVAELSELFKSEQKERKIIEQEKALEEELSQRLLVQNKLENSKQQNRLIIIILLISLGLFVAIYINIRNRNRQEQLKKKQKEIELQQTLLRSQMNPHFIFNAMSVIQSYIYDEDIVNSSKFLIHFSKLMRLILENNAKEFISLDKELEIINRYLVIQKMRFEDRFEFIIEDNINEDHSRIAIPPMMVQPFIENAIEHGDLDNVENGLIRIKCEIVGNLFIFIIEDNGVGRKAAIKKKKSADSENHRSMAIELTKGRISLLNEKYKIKGSLKIEDLDKENETGTSITISTPFKMN
ncbi:tetratricopeptide repeat protein [Brumimicrobium glaciale]|uniref:Tetratricopeptide repeat protein n=1 Tax=Brumimicrobium glaciale TaxID=200475 RepID=A0A4Q4KQM5_9FLAO|nr:histidine kinase [Brumimicrobium glaciale]RYM35463.1 tetratricopeptide repeat protein [Brumimicrobium glaciale]